MKIIIIGYGSTGQRHYRNLVAMGFNDISVYDPDLSKLTDVKKVEKLSEDSFNGFDAAFICSPTNLHIKAAIMAAKAGCHLFIEKPLSHSLKNVEELEKISVEKKLITMIGCNMRFHPALAFTKKFLDKQALGRIYRIGLEYGYYLPYWRPDTDYKVNYAVRKSTGGGILLDDIHEYDLLFW